MIHIDSIIFDLDGTLVDSRQDIVNAVNYTLGVLGLKQKGFNTIVSYVGTGIDDLVIKSLGRENKNMAKKSVEIFEGYYKKHSADAARLYPNVKDVLEHYKDKNLFIVTNRKKYLAEITLKSFGIYKYFKSIVGGEEAGCLKPSSCPLRKVVVPFGLDKKKTLMVGDMDLDIFAGKKMGVITCGVTYGIGKKGQMMKAKPDFVIDDIGQLMPVFS